MENENTFRVTIVYHENITDLVYFSKGKIVKYAKKVGNNSSYLDILYTVKKGLNINTNNKDSDFVDLIPNEVKRMNNLENIKDITLKKVICYYMKYINYFIVILLISSIIMIELGHKL